jgi:hypothetical protein
MLASPCPDPIELRGAGAAVQSAIDRADHFLVFHQRLIQAPAFAASQNHGRRRKGPCIGVIAARDAIGDLDTRQARQLVVHPRAPLGGFLRLGEVGRLGRLLPRDRRELAPLDAGVAAAVELIDRNLVPDMPDRIIAATALSLGAALVSRDRKIRSSQIHTIW